MNNIFPTLVYQKKYTGDLKKLQDHIIPNMDPVINAARDNNQAAMREGAVCSAMSFIDLTDFFDLSDLYSFVRDCVKEYWKEMEYREAEIDIGNTWLNTYPKGGYIDNHNHAPSLIGATFYLKKPENSGDIVFENPISTIRRYEPFKALENANAYATESVFNHKVVVQEGELILFPGWLTHRTEPNMSDNDRIVLAFDILPKF